MAKHRAHGNDRARSTGDPRHAAHSVEADPRIRSILARIDDHGLAWEDLADDVLPIFERAHPFGYDIEPPLQAVVPPGVTVGFGIDAGPAFLRVASTHLADWPVDLDGLTERALRNLRRRIRAARDYDLVSAPVGGVSTTVFQSREGWASTAVLLPEAIERLFGASPALFIAPARDLLVRLPADVDPAFATWLTEEFEASDPNALRLEAFEWRDGTVSCRPLQRDAVAV